MRFLSFFVQLVVISSICVQADARITLSCEGIFAPTLTEIFIQAQHQFKTDFPNLSKLTLEARSAKKLRSILKSQSLQDITSRPELIQKQQEITDVIFRHGKDIDSLLFRSPKEREQIRLQKLLFETILEKGFQGHWQGPLELSGLAKLRAQWVQLKSKSYFQLTLLPWFLPKVEGPQVSSELLVKILDQGLEANSLEIQKVLKAQSRAEAYQIFRKLYSPVVLGSLFLVQSYFAYEALQIDQQQQVERSIEELKKAGIEIESMLSEARQQIVDEAYENILIEFRQKYGEDPTESEKRQIREKIILHLKKSELSSP